MGLAAYGDTERFAHLRLFEYEGPDVYFNRAYLKELENTSKSDFFFHELFKISESDYLAREKDITKSIFADMAAKVQKDTEEAMVYLANEAYRLTGSENLCLAGGVALNILANTKILENTPFKRVFVCPAAHDAGISLGAAYHAYHVIGKNTQRLPLVSAGLGKIYDEEEIAEALQKYAPYLRHENMDGFDEVAQQLKEGAVIGWFQGGSEF